MSDLSPLPLVLTTTDRLHRSALPGAPVVPVRARRRHLRAASLEKE